jgi:hypothetical protein
MKRLEKKAHQLLLAFREKRMRKTQIEKLLGLLLRRYGGVTSEQAAKYGISRVPARVYELRNAGYRIWTNYKTNKRNGKKEHFFRLDNSHRL